MEVHLCNSYTNILAVHMLILNVLGKLLHTKGTVHIIGSAGVTLGIETAQCIRFIIQSKQTKNTAVGGFQDIGTFSTLDNIGNNLMM